MSSTDDTPDQAPSPGDAAAGTASLNPGYVLHQLRKALSGLEHHAEAAARERASKKVERWQKVIEGMLGGSLEAGSRTPVAGAPAWATLEVVTGGFATGQLQAGGPLAPHEVELATRLGAEGSPSRAALNLHYLSDAGRAELAAMLKSGHYRVQVPEEGALLVVTWLVQNGHAERAQDVIDAILAFVDRLRFYPVPATHPPFQSAFVKRSTVGEVARGLDATRRHAQVERMNESLRVWTPLGDRAVALFLETVEGEAPHLGKDAKGELARRPDGQPIILGGWPCKSYPAGWVARAKALLSEIEGNRATHRLCKKPEKVGANLAILRGGLERCVRDPASLTGREVGLIRRALASFVSRHGLPGSAEHRRLRDWQRAIAARPTNRELSTVVSARLRALPAESGLESLGAVSVPLSGDESKRFGVAAGAAIPESIVLKLERCLEAPVEHLVLRGVIPSSEVLAQVLPQITSQVDAAGFADPDLARLYGAVYSAFRKRRSLLLLNLESQVRMSELPWIAALAPSRAGGLDVKERARRTLAQVVELALSAFPETILPNKLLGELRPLVQSADLEIPLVDELAADIFMGEFSAKFVESAKIAARLLRGSLYARYYDLPVERVLAIDDIRKKYKRAAPSSAAFAELCRERAGERNDNYAAYNGKIIEQEQILTTHNLAALFVGLKLGDALRGRLAEMAQACFRFICKSEQTHVEEWHAKLVRVKNSAYAWRQMVFFLSLAGEDVVEPFLAWAAEHLQAQETSFGERFDPVFFGLQIAARGGDLSAADRQGVARRFVGWSTERHWLLVDR